MSTQEHPEVVGKYIMEECAEGRLLGQKATVSINDGIDPDQCLLLHT